MTGQPLNPTGLLGHYRVDLLFDEDAGTTDAFVARCAEIDGLEVEPRRDGAVTLRLVETLERGAAPEWTLGAPEAVDRAELEPLLEHSWGWREAAAVASGCRLARALTDHLFVTLDHRRRLHWFQRVLAAAVETLPCRAIAWRPSGQLVSPDELLATLRSDGFESPSPGALNLRLFRLDEDGAFLMDTLGLGAVGLLDLQCRFRALDPDEVSHVLQATAFYLWIQGPVVRPGNTVQGVRPEDRWRCSARTAMAPPERELLDLDPGFPFGAEE